MARGRRDFVVANLVLPNPETIHRRGGGVNGYDRRWRYHEPHRHPGTRFGTLV